MNTLVIALGGNALQKDGQSATAENQLDVVRMTAAQIAPLALEHRLMVVHGNGPQVGRLVLQNEYAQPITPAMPFDVCGAMSQGLIGYHLQQALTQAFKALFIPQQAVTVLTQVVVDGNDPAFSHPTKPIGPFYREDQAKLIAGEKGFTMKEDAGRGWRRVVASPMPQEIVELSAIKALSDGGFVPVCVGGGGIPVLRGEDGTLFGTAAVIDKDLAAQKLACDVGAKTLLILTAVEAVCIHWGKPEQQTLSTLSAPQAEKYLKDGHFAPGSMGPKMEAAIRFVRSGEGRVCIITSLDKAAQALAGHAGTRVHA